MQVCLCVLKRRKAEGGIGGRAQRLPKAEWQDVFSQAMLQAKTSVYVSVFRFFVYINIHKIYREVFCKCVFVSWKKKSGRGDWGEGAAPPPKAEWQDLFSQAVLHAKTQHLPQKQNDNTYFHKQCYMQKRRASPQSRTTISIFTSKATSKNICICLYIIKKKTKRIKQYLYIYI